MSVAAEKKILLSKFKDNCTIDKKMASDLVQESFTIINSFKLQLGLVDNRADFLTSTEEARALLSNNKSLSLLKAQAVLVNTLADRININYFIQVAKPIIPFRAFEEEKEALNWLGTFMKT